jgi:hypothetical protein
VWKRSTLPRSATVEEKTYRKSGSKTDTIQQQANARKARPAEIGELLAYALVALPGYGDCAAW